MCGICGIWQEPNPNLVEAMIEAMDHRGPDDRGLFVDENVALGMSRLAIIDLSATGHQPMSNAEQSIWIVYNGEVFNFQSERELLETQGCVFRSNSDTEVVLRLYERYGDDFLLRLRGMFALAIYDKRRPGKERLLLARDHLGIKPLLHARVGKRLIFGSELKTILASGLIQPEIDPVALRMLLTYGSVYQPRTMLRGVTMLLPAHRLIVEAGRERIERYWSFQVDRHAGLRARPYDDLVERVAAALQESVRLHMVSDVPLGAFLSGGVDSSLLVGLMTRVAGHRIKTFSVGFEPHGTQIDESDEAEATARFLGADHTRVIVRGAEMRDHVERIVAALDQPSVDGVNSYFVSRVARQRVTVAISGTGGDELFAGYPWFAQMAAFEHEGVTESKVIGEMASQAFFDRLLFGRWGNYLYNMRMQAGFLPRYATVYRVFEDRGAATMLAPGLWQRASVGRAPLLDQRPQDELPKSPAVERVTALCLRGYTNNQLLRDIDVTSMSHSLEVRVPFLDVPLVDLSLSLPTSAKLGHVDSATDPYRATYRSSGSKRILVDAGRRLGVLREDIDLQPKRGFTLPFDAWLKDSLRDVFEDTLSAEVVRERGLLQTKRVDCIRQSFLDGKIHWSQPWLLMVLELWCRAFLDGKSESI